MKIIKGDEIIVTAGKEKGRRGKVEKIVNSESVVVSGLNLVKRHLKKRDEKSQGGIIDIPKPLPFGRIALVCPKCKKPTRVGYQVNAQEKHRICRKCKQMI